MMYQLEFKDLKVTGTRVKKEFLHEVSGLLQPGKMTAIMGSSGAGKSVLLSCLSGRSGSEFKLEGDILINGESASQKDLKSSCAIVLQDDIMLSNLTVREQISFHARFGLANQFDDEEVEKRVDSVIEELELSRCQHTRVGAPGVKRGVSGGERKRTAIAMELVADPAILLLDEPTSGLDSHISLHVLQTLRRVANRGRTVAFSIHQPSSEIFALFDNLILLCEGQIVYFGPADRAANHFSDLGFPIPEQTNPAEFLLSLTHQAASIRRKREAPKSVGGEKLDVEMEPPASVQEDLIDQFLRAQCPPLEIQQYSLERPLRDIVRDKIRNRISSLQQFKYLSLRANKQFIRTGDVWIRLIQTIGVTLFCSLLFINLGIDAQGVQSRLGLLFVLQMQFSFMTAQSAVLLFPLERPVFLREQAKNLYHTFWYFLAKNVVEAPLNIIGTVLSVTIAYFIGGLRSGAEHFFQAVLIYILVGFMGQGIGFLVGAGISDVGKGMEVAPSLIIPQMLVGGLFLNLNDIPDFLIWLEKISFIRWSFEALVWNEFEGASLTPSLYAPTGSGDEVMSFLGFTWSYWASLGMLVLITIVYRIIAYLLLRQAAKKAPPV